MGVRVRYPPSPTGLQHIGGVRTALFNYFLARSLGGTFVLRIEDTDQTRFDPKALADLYETLEWLGLDWDEGPERGGDHTPYVQSERADLYRSYAAQLLDGGHAYRCFCTAARLDQMRSQQGKETGYDRKCRSIDAAESDRLVDSGTSFVIRLKIPLEGSTEFEDLLLGKIRRKNKDIAPDPVLLKSDKLPTYHLANVIDDHLMGISHILRAQEWLSSVPIHIALYRAFDWAPPLFCHLPLVLGKDGQKLSKRHGSTALRDFREAGYLPEAILNYVSLLGWSYDGQREFFSREELEELFSLEQLNKAPAVFDHKKLDWFNGQYIRRCSDERLMSLIIPFLVKDAVVTEPPTDRALAIIRGALPLVRERLKRLDEVSRSVRFLFGDLGDYEIETLVPKKSTPVEALQGLLAGRSILGEFDDLSDDELESRFRDTAESMGLKLGTLLMPIRVAVTGTVASPPLFGSIRLLGKGTAIERVDRAIERLKEHVGG